MQHAAPVLVRRGRRRAWMGSIKPVLGPGRALDKRQWLRYLSVLVVALLASACERPTSPMTTQTALPFHPRTAGWWRWQLSAAAASLRLDS